MTQAQANYDAVNLMLRLYDIRREPRLRQARAWFVDHFHPVSPEEAMKSIRRAATRIRTFAW